MFQFQGFTEKANKALNLAVQSAEQFGHSYVGTEHVLLGLLQEGSGVAYAALTSCGVTADSISQRVQANEIGGAPTHLTADALPSICSSRWSATATATPSASSMKQA